MPPSPHLPVSFLVCAAAISLAVVVLSWFYWKAAVRVAFVVFLFEEYIYQLFSPKLQSWGLYFGRELIVWPKDLFLLGAYLRFFFTPKIWMQNVRLQAPVKWIVVLALGVALGGLNSNIPSVILSLAGMKVYLFYLPLVFLVPYLFESVEDAAAELSIYALLGVLVGAMALKQYSISQENLSGFQVRHALPVAITGTFNKPMSLTAFVLFFAALQLGLLIASPLHRLKPALFLSLLVVLASGYVGQFRSVAVGLGVILFVLGLTLIFRRPKTNKGCGFMRWKNPARLSIFIPTVLVALGAAMVLVGTIFWGSRAQAWLGYYDVAPSTGPSSLARAWESAGLQGYGIGSEHPAVEGLRKLAGLPLPKLKAPLFDIEMWQVFGEIGLVGVLVWYGLKCLAIGTSLVAFGRAEKNLPRTLALTMATFQIPYFLLRSEVDGTANFLLFAAWGLALMPLRQEVSPTGRFQRRPAK